MFSWRSNASKVAFAYLVQQLIAWGVQLIDCQVPTDHLASFGAQPMPRRAFLKVLAEGLRRPTRCGKWDFSLRSEF